MVGPLKQLEKNPRFHKVFRHLSDNWNIKPQVLKQLELFTCLMYGQSRESLVDIVHAKLLCKMVVEEEKLTSKSKVNQACLPPCHCALKLHVQHVNHHVTLYKQADEPILKKPKPYDEGQGWMRTDEGVLEPMWSSGPVLPTSLIDLLDTGDHEEEEEEEEDFIESDDE